MSVTDPFIGHRLGDYKIVDILGRGGMARVYRGFDERLNRYAAVKVIDAALLSGGEDEYRLRFLREARAIATLDHPAIVSVYQFGEFEGLYYMAMKFIEGRDLGQILKEDGGASLTSAGILRIVRDVAGALDYAHAAGVIHRDVKPSNIMVTKDGHGILTDFGLALSVPEGSIGNTFGSAHYIAPEQAISSAQAVAQSDLYSLGVVIYQMFTGRVPFDDPSAMTVALKHLSDPPPPPRTFNPNITMEVERIILRMLEKEIENRYESGAQLVYALEAALGMAPRADFIEPVPFSASEFKGDLGSNTRQVPPEIGSSELTPIKRRSEEFAALRLPPDSKPSRSTASLGRHLRAESAPSQSKITTTASLPRVPITADKPPRSRMPLLIGGIAALIVIGALLIIGGGLDRGTPIAGDETPGTPVALAGAAITADVTADVTEDVADLPTSASAMAVTEDVTEEATVSNDTPVSTPTRTRSATPTRTRTPAAPTATRTPAGGTAQASTVTRTTRPIAAAGTMTPVMDRADVALIYDELTFIVHNVSNNDVDLSGWRFSQTLPTGAIRSFDANAWDEGSRPVFALPPNDCFQVWDILTPGQLALPDFCGVRHAWRAIAPQRQFWISPSNDPAAAFDVRDADGTLLARCPIATGQCLITLSDDI